MNNLTLAAEWSKIEESLIEGGCEARNRQEFKDAWYAGAYDTVHLMLEMAQVDDKQSFEQMHTDVHAYMEKAFKEVDLEPVRTATH
jgi:hypothetical protein